MGSLLPPSATAARPAIVSICTNRPVARSLTHKHVVVSSRLTIRGLAQFRRDVPAIASVLRCSAAGCCNAWHHASAGSSFHQMQSLLTQGSCLPSAMLLTTELRTGTRMVSASSCPSCTSSSTAFSPRSSASALRCTSPRWRSGAGVRSESDVISGLLKGCCLIQSRKHGCDNQGGIVALWRQIAHSGS